MSVESRFEILIQIRMWRLVWIQIAENGLKHEPTTSATGSFFQIHRKKKELPAKGSPLIHLFYHATVQDQQSFSINLCLPSVFR